MHRDAITLAGLVERDSRRRAAGRLLGRLVAVPLVGPHLARLARAPMSVPWLTTRVTRIHARLLALSGGRLRRSWLFAGGQPVVALTTTGRRSGRPRTTAVACFGDGEDLVVAAMNLGMANDPAWALNHAANPDAAIAIRGVTVAVVARRARGAEAARLWQRWLSLQPSAQAFKDLAGREIPLFVLRPAS